MIGTPRLLPVMTALAALLLAMKLGDVWRGAAPVLAGLTVAEARAEEAGEKLAAATVADTRSGSADADADPSETLRLRLRDAIEGLVEQELDAALGRRRALIEESDSMFTRAEVEVLESLTERRQALQARSETMDMRENLLAAAERRIDEKIAELGKLEASIKALLKTYDEEEEAKMKSLVKIYENMKPKDAARIFDELDMDILLEVAERMREAKVAPILAQMNAAKAKTITVELATRRQLPRVDG